MDPQTATEWQQVAKNRLLDARCIQQQEPDSTGIAYLSGYGVECALKAYAHAMGKGVEKHHDLVNLTHAAGLQLNIFKNGSWFLDDWSVNWRYQTDTAALPCHPAQCLAAAGQLQGYILKQSRRMERRQAMRGK